MHGVYRGVYRGTFYFYLLILHQGDNFISLAGDVTLLA
jgi:hypothetical protein